MATLECFCFSRWQPRDCCVFFNVVVVVNLKKCKTVSQDVFPNFVAVQDVFLWPKFFL